MINAQADGGVGEICLERGRGCTVGVVAAGLTGTRLPGLPQIKKHAAANAKRQRQGRTVGGAYMCVCIYTHHTHTHTHARLKRENP